VEKFMSRIPQELTALMAICHVTRTTKCAKGRNNLLKEEISNEDVAKWNMIPTVLLVTFTYILI